jgi:putative membrane protein
MLPDDFNLLLEPGKEDEEKVIRRYEEMLRQNRTEYFEEEEWGIIIDYYLLEERFAESLQAVELARLQFPFSLGVKMCHAAVLLRSNHVPQGMEMLREIETTGGSDCEISFLKGVGYLLLKNTDMAVACFTECVHQTMEDMRVQMLTDIAIEFLEENEAEKALPFVQWALQLDPDDVNALNEMAYCQECLGNFDESIAYYERYSKQFPFSDRAWDNLGNVHLQKGNYSKAVEAFDFALTLNGENTSALCKLGDTLLQQGKYEKALQTYIDCLKLEPGNMKILSSISTCLAQLERDEAMIGVFQTSLALNPNAADAHYGLGLFYMDTDPEKALEHARKAVQVEKSHGNYWFILGSLLMHLGKNEEALHACEQGITLKCEGVEVQLDAWIYMVTKLLNKDTEQVLAFLEKALAHHPENTPLRYRMAGMYLLDGYLPQCLDHLEQALQRQPDDMHHLLAACPKAMQFPEVRRVCKAYKGKHTHKHISMKRGFKNYLLLAAKGIAMGAADVIPGVSGGTIAFISGIYEELISSIKSINPTSLKMLVRGKIADFWQAINGRFLLAVAGGILISIFSLAKVMLYLLEHHPIPTWSFFFGLILAAIWYVVIQVKKPYWLLGLYFLLGAAGAFVLTHPGLMPASMPHSYPFLFLAGAIAICAMILPGISGSFILALLGQYYFVLAAVSSLNLPVIAVFAAGAILGLIAFSNVLSWLLRKFHDITVVILGGFMLGSLNKIWPWKEVLTTTTNQLGKEVPQTQQNILPNAYQQLVGDAHLPAAIGLFLAGVALVFVIEIIAKLIKKTV